MQFPVMRAAAAAIAFLAAVGPVALAQDQFAYDSTLTLTGTPTQYPYAAAVVSGSLFSGTDMSPAYVIKTDLSTFTQTDVVEMTGGGGALNSACADHAATYVYFGKKKPL